MDKEQQQEQQQAQRTHRPVLEDGVRVIPNPPSFHPTSPFWYGFWSVYAAPGYFITGKPMPTYEEFIERELHRWTARHG